MVNYVYTILAWKYKIGDKFLGILNVYSMLNANSYALSTFYKLSVLTKLIKNILI